MVKFKKYLVLFLVAAIIASLLPPEISTAATWNLVWNDEFDGNSLNTNNWVYDIGTGSGGWGNNELQYYTNRTDNVKVENGNLVITAKKENYGGMGYTSGRIKTKGKASWKYGKIEARMKIPTGQGIWPAFWMLGDNIDSVGWPKCGEIDVMEHVNNESVTHGTIHWDYNGYQYYGLQSGNLDFSQYHTYTVEWDSTSIKWYVDGTQYCEANITINDTNEFHNKFFILLNLAVGGNWPGSPNSSTSFPQAMYVDYVRVYQQGSGSGGDTGGGSSGGTTDLTAARNAAYNWLCAQQVPSGNAFAGWVDSFEDYWGDGSRKTIAYTYDQAVAAIAFTLMGDNNRAKQVLNMLKSTQDSAGYWINSYWWNNGAGEEIRAHVGPCMWVALAVMNYEKKTGDMSYHDMAIKTIDWCLQFQKSNGALSGGLTTWDSGNGSWTEEVWSSTEQNQDAYAALVYFASTTSSKQSTYTTAANKIKSFLDNVVWDSTKNRWYGGFKNNTNSVDPFVPMDVNPWGVMALGTSGTRNYGKSIEYVENTRGGTLSSPQYAHTLPYGNTTITAYDFDWQSNGAAADSKIGGGYLGADIWFEGSAFMSCAYSMLGNETKANAILSEIAKKQGKDGSMSGGIPYCLNGTNNNYWLMLQQNCVSSTGWFIIAASKWNPFKGEPTNSGSGGTGGGYTLPTGYVKIRNRATNLNADGYGFTSNGSVCNQYADSTSYNQQWLLEKVDNTYFKIKNRATGLYLDNLGSTANGADVAQWSSSGSYNQQWSVETTGSYILIKNRATGLCLDGMGRTTNGSAMGQWASSGSYNQHWTFVNVQDSGGGTTETVATPAFSVPGGNYSSEQKVKLSCATSGATIYYTTNGSDPTTSSTKYDREIKVNATTTIKAIAVKSGMNNSAIASATYTFGGGSGGGTETVATPTFYPAGGTYSSAQSVSISCSTSGATLRYTTDGSTPTANSPQYTVPFTVSSNTTVKVIAIKSGMNNSAVASATYVINGSTGGSGSSTAVSAPVFSISGGTYSSKQKVTLSCATSGATMYYTTDGSTPTSKSKKYDREINVDKSMTVKAIAIKSGMTDSSVVTQTYVISGGAAPAPKK